MMYSQLSALSTGGASPVPSAPALAMAIPGVHPSMQSIVQRSLEELDRDNAKVSRETLSAYSMEADVSDWLATSRETWDQEQINRILNAVKNGQFKKGLRGDEAIVEFLRMLRQKLGDAEFVEVMRQLPDEAIANACMTLFAETESQELTTLIDIKIALSYLVAFIEGNPSLNAKFNDLEQRLQNKMEQLPNVEQDLDWDYFGWKAGFDKEKNFFANVYPYSRATWLRLFSNPYQSCLSTNPNLREGLISGYILEKESAAQLLSTPNWRTLFANILRYIPSVNERGFSFSSLKKHHRMNLASLMAHALQIDQQALSAKKTELSLPSDENKKILRFTRDLPDFPFYWRMGICFQGTVDHASCEWLKMLWAASPAIDHRSIKRGERLRAEGNLTKQDQIVLAHFFPDLFKLPNGISFAELKNEKDWFSRIVLLASAKRYDLVQNLSEDQFIELVLQDFAVDDHANSNAARKIVLRLVKERLSAGCPLHKSYQALLDKLYLHTDRDAEFWLQFEEIAALHPQFFAAQLREFYTLLSLNYSSLQSSREKLFLISLWARSPTVLTQEEAVIIFQNLMLGTTPESTEPFLVLEEKYQLPFLHKFVGLKKIP